MPDEGAGHEAETEAGVPQPPAEIHVVASGVDLRIEAADGVERGPRHGQVAARQVLGLLVV